MGNGISGGVDGDHRTAMYVGESMSRPRSRGRPHSWTLEGVWGRVAGTAATRDSWGLVGCRNAVTAGRTGMNECRRMGFFL